MLYPDECYAIRGAIYEVYRELGNGFKEEVYQQCLEREFASRGIPFDAKKELHIFYKGAPIEKTYIPDFYCYGKIIVEIKAPPLRNRGGILFHGGVSCQSPPR